MKLYDVSKKLHRYLDPVQKDEKEEKLSDLLAFTEKYLNLATLQMERLNDFEQASSNMNGVITDPEQLKLVRLYFGDIQFFFNSIHKFLVFTQRLMNRLNMTFPKNFSETEKHFRTIRNHFEHIDERIERSHLYRMDFGSVSERKLTVDNVDYDLSADSLLTLYVIYDEVINEIGLFIEPRKHNIDLFWEGLEHNMKLDSQD